MMSKFRFVIVFISVLLLIIIYIIYSNKDMDDLKTYTNNQFNFSFNYPTNLFVVENSPMLPSIGDGGLFYLGLSDKKIAKQISDFQIILKVKNQDSAIIPAKDNDDNLVYIIENQFVYIFTRTGLEVNKFREIIKSFMLHFSL